MPTSTHLIPFFLLLLLAAACGDKDAVSPNPASAEVLFMREGTRWEFDYQDGFSEDVLVMTVEKELSKDTFLVRNSTEVGYVLPEQYYVLKEGNLYVSYRHRDASTYQIECKFGQPVGTSWQVSKFGQTYTYTIDSLNASVRTGRGLVTDAIKVKMRLHANNREGYQYISPSVGILGSGHYGGTGAMQLKDYTVSTAASSAPASLPISFGDFPFMKAGNFWTYSLSTFADDDVLKIEILSKLPSQNIYKVRLTLQSANQSNIEYWYEDRGRLMVYEEGESLRQADPIYSNVAQTAVGHGWTGTTSRGTVFVYKVVALNVPTTTYYGELPSMEVDVYNGLFSVQTNHWNPNKGLVLVNGFLYQNIIDSNVRKLARIPLPFCGY
jgi:hypothetical protein